MMEDQEKNTTPENPNIPPRNPKEAIPLWLQGLEEDAASSRDEEAQSSEGWVREAENAQPSPERDVSANFPAFDDQEDTAEVSTTPSAAEKADDSLPDWLDELAKAPSESPEDKEEDQERQEGFYTADDEPEAVIPRPESHFSEGTFIDISEADLEHITENPTPTEDEMLPDDEELPEWLHEMILENPEENPAESADLAESTEPVQIAPAEGEEIEISAGLGSMLDALTPEGLLDEETAPIALQDSEPDESLFSEPEPASEELTMVEVIEESEADIPAEINPAEAPEEPLPGSVELKEDPAKTDIDEPQEGQEEVEDTLPVPTAESPEEPEKVLNSSEESPDSETEHTQPVSIPKTLRFAKYVLDQGDTGRALDIIHTYIKQASYLDEIKSWLVEAASTSPTYQSEIWESIGDIAVCQSNHQEALSAYTKAIKNLLLNKEAYGTR